MAIETPKELEEIQGDESDSPFEDEQSDGPVGSGSEAAPSGGNAAWADAMRKVLNVKTENPAKLILARKRKPKSEAGEDGESDLKKQAVKAMKIRIAKKEWQQMARVKPSVLEREREKRLSKIATKGVVQLFNAVEQHQKKLRAELEAAGPTEVQKEKKLAQCGEDLFLEVLNRQKVKKEPEDDEDEKPRWEVLTAKPPKSVKISDWQSDSDSD